MITPDEYAEGVGESLEANGFHEVEIHRVTEEYGQIAHAFSTYESRRLASDPEPFARGINSIQLMNDGCALVGRVDLLARRGAGPSDSGEIPAGGRGLTGVV